MDFSSLISAALPLITGLFKGKSGDDIAGGINKNSDLISSLLTMFFNKMKEPAPAPQSGIDINLLLSLLLGKGSSMPPNMPPIGGSPSGISILIDGKPLEQILLELKPAG